METIVLSNGKVLDPYTACGIAEGFDQDDSLTENDILLAWSYIGTIGLYRSLQGWYGRTLRDLIDQGLLDENFNIIRHD